MSNIKWGIGIENETNMFFENMPKMDLREISFLYSNRDMRLKNDPGDTFTDVELTNFISNYKYRIIEINKNKTCCESDMSYNMSVMVQIPEVYKLYDIINSRQELDYSEWVNKDMDGTRNYFELQTPKSRIQVSIRESVQSLVSIKNKLEDDMNIIINENIDDIKNMLNLNDFDLGNAKFPFFGSERFILSLYENSNGPNYLGRKNVPKKIVTNKTGSYHLNLTLPYNQILLHDIIIKNFIEPYKFIKNKDNSKEDIKRVKNRYKPEMKYYNSMDNTRQKERQWYPLQENIYKFMEREHLIWALHIQMIEPLLLGVFGGPDSIYFQELFGNYFTKGSLRLLMEHDLGILSTDLSYGFPNDRYPNVNGNPNYLLYGNIFEKKNLNDIQVPLWRQKFDNVNEMKYYPISKIKDKIVELKEETDKVETTFYVGTDFRRDINKVLWDLERKLDELKKNNMDILNDFEVFGFEFRMLDNFDSRYLENILELLFLIAEDSKGKDWEEIKITNNPYQLDLVHENIKNIFIHGYMTKLSGEYITYLGEMFRLDFSSSTNTCYEVLNFLYQELQKRYILNQVEYNSSIYIKYLIETREEIYSMPNSNKEQLNFHMNKFLNSETNDNSSYLSKLKLYFNNPKNQGKRLPSNSLSEALKTRGLLNDENMLVSTWQKKYIKYKTKYLKLKESQKN